MSHKDRLRAFGEQAGFAVNVEDGVIRAVEVPCLLADGSVCTCTIEKSFDPASGKPTNQIGGDIHVVRIAPDGGTDGRVYNADGSSIGNHIGGDEKNLV